MLDNTAIRKQKAKSIFLTKRQLWDVDKYCIENKGVAPDPQTGRFDKFRISKKKLANEISLLHFKCNYNHIGQAMEFYSDCLELTENLAKVPVQTSVQEDMLNVEIAKKDMEITALKNQLDALKENLKAYIAREANYKERFSQIRKLGTI